MRRDRVEVKRTGDQHNKSKGYSREFHSAGESHQGPIQVKGVPLVSGPSPNNLPHFGPQRMAISKEGQVDVETDIHLLRSGYLRQNLTGDLHEVQLPLRVFGLAGDPGDRVRKPPVGIAGWQVVGIRRVERLGRSFRLTLLQ